MKSIERRFRAALSENPQLSDFVAFSRAIRTGHFSRSMISRHFNRLVDKSDYCAADKKLLIRHLVELSNEKRTSEDDKKSAQAGRVAMF